jgi:hypothetical protein
MRNEMQLRMDWIGKLVGVGEMCVGVTSFVPRDGLNVVK